MGDSVYIYIKNGQNFMDAEPFSCKQQKLEFVQFIAEISLVANCKPSELKFTLNLIADLVTIDRCEHDHSASERCW